MLMLGLILGVIGLISYGGFIQDALKIRGIVIEGGERITSDDVQGIIQIGVGDNFFGADFNAAAAALQKHPWVRSAAVSFQYPNLHIALQERQPFVIAQVPEQGLMWCDETGHVLAPLLDEEVQQRAGVLVTGLGPATLTPSGPRLGDEAQWQAVGLVLRANLEPLPPLVELRFVPEGLDLRTQDGRRARLPLVQTGEALRRLILIWPALEKRVSLRALDLRIAGEFVFEGEPHSSSR